VEVQISLLLLVLRTELVQPTAKWVDEGKCWQGIGGSQENTPTNNRKRYLKAILPT